MKIVNIHQRIINQPLSSISPILMDISVLNKMFWPNEKWPSIKFKGGLKVGHSGGHGPIRYDIEAIQPDQFIQFKFTRPKGIHGIHKLELSEINNHTTQIKHSIIARSSGTGTIKWLGAIRWLHDALMEDALDKIENHFSTIKKESPYNLWVRLIRKISQ